MTHLAVHVDVGEEVHFDGDGSVPGTVLTPAALDVEAETTRLIAAHFCLLGLRKESTDFVKDTGVRGWITPRGAANGRLIDVDNFVEVVHTLDSGVEARYVSCTVESVCEGPIHNVIDEGGLPRAADAGNGHHHTQGNIHGQVTEIVSLGALHGEHPFGVHRSSLTHGEHGFTSGEIIRRDGALLLEQAGQGSLVDHFAAKFSRSWTDVDDPVGSLNGFLIVFHNDQGVP